MQTPLNTWLPYTRAALPVFGTVPRDNHGKRLRPDRFTYGVRTKHLPDAATEHRLYAAEDPDDCTRPLPVTGINFAFSGLEKIAFQCAGRYAVPGCFTPEMSGEMSVVDRRERYVDQDCCAVGRYPGE